MTPTIVLISGANRGLGKGLLERYLARPNHVVIAANRNPEDPTSIALANLPKGENSRLVVVKLDASVEPDASNAIKQLVSDGIDHLDIVVANAAVSYAWPKISEAKSSDIQGHLTANFFGVIWLYQAAFSLLKKSMNPRWITMGSVGGKIGPPVSNAAYAPSKIAVHWLTKRMDAEEDWLTAFVVSPGWVPTRMGLASADGVGLPRERMNLSLDESCDGMKKVIDAATKESHGGRFWSYDGQQESW
ncbi:hypothetical protein AAE478_003816 [Parahypoxylon ruwenzoriense]